MRAPAPDRPDLLELDRDISGALQELRSARTSSTRSPNARTARSEALAEGRLNWFLECRFVAQRADRG